MKAAFLTEAASEHLQQVAYYEARQAGLGARYLAEVNAAIEQILEAPQRFPIIRPPALRRLGLKRFPFTVFFRVRGDVVQIVAIAPHRRRPGYWSGRF